MVSVAHRPRLRSAWIDCASMKISHYVILKANIIAHPYDKKILERMVALELERRDRRVAL